MTDVWSERAAAYRDSPIHRDGPDLDLLVDWAGPGSGRTALDVATGGGHLARRLREAGFEIVTADRAPGMHPDVVCTAEDLPFADESFDVVATRIAAHHFDDPAAAVAEMARVTRDLLLVEDNVYVSETAEQIARLRDPTHVRCYSEQEWRELVGGVGLHVEEVRMLERQLELDTWLGLTGCDPETASRVRTLAEPFVDDGHVRASYILLRAVKR